MGGSGSGNHYHWWRSGKKTVVEDCLSIDAAAWMRAGILRAGSYASGNSVWTYRSGKTFRVTYRVDTEDLASPTLHLSYRWVRTATGQVDSAGYTVQLTTTRAAVGRRPGTAASQRTGSRIWASASLAAFRPSAKKAATGIRLGWSGIRQGDITMKWLAKLGWPYYWRIRICSG